MESGKNVLTCQSDKSLKLLPLAKTIFLILVVQMKMYP